MLAAADALPPHGTKFEPELVLVMKLIFSSLRLMVMPLCNGDGDDDCFDGNGNKIRVRHNNSNAITPAPTTKRALTG